MEKFFVGADIGTESVGVACTDQNYNLLRAKGKDCWAVRLFEEGETAKKRRTFRATRRRLKRRKYRIGLLQELFAPYIADKTFFIRLNNSQLLAEDKDVELRGDKNALFADKEYTDKDFYKAYPTIYHLRDALQTQPIKDERLYYLALHHLIKYRGHFLFDGSLNEVRDVCRLFAALNAVCADIYEDDAFEFCSERFEQAKEELMKPVGVRDKQAALTKLFNAADSSVAKEIIKGLCGASVSPSVLFGEEYKENKSVSFRGMTDEVFLALAADYDDNYALLQAMRDIYGFVTFEKLLAGHDNVSSAMVALYDKHKSDLVVLKGLVKRYATQEVYRKMFKYLDQKANYVNYVGYTKKDGVKKRAKHVKDEDFLAYVKKFVNELGCDADDQDFNYVLKEIEAGTFLPKILHADNGLFPRQINEYELNKILDNMVVNLPQTAEIADKARKIFNFRIPYYVGPLTGKNSWVKKLSQEKITPYNFDDVVDKAASNQEFMLRMTNKCSYLNGEDVLPKDSVIYQRFNVLNQLNKLKINDKAISVPLKQQIFDELFLKERKVTDKKIKDFLVKKGYFSVAEKNEIALSGKDGDFNASMSSYIQLKKILGDFVDKDLNDDGGVCENIILWHTLNTDKSLVEKLIDSNYGKIPQIAEKKKELKGLSFNKFGKLSKMFLTGLKTVDKQTGEYMSILDLMYRGNQNQNLNEILYDEKYNFGQIIADYNAGVEPKSIDDEIDQLYVSPAVRRGIRQTLLMIKEYVDAIGKQPDKIFIEVTREDGVKGDAGRTQSRKRQLLEKYKAVNGFDDIVSELKDEEITDDKLRKERLYLYFRQLGRCMYSGERINLDNLNTDLYDVDHVLPRCYIKDDSLDNKVLVLRSKNAAKSDKYPLPQGFSNQQNFWKLLRDKNLIAAKTYDRLTRTDPLTNDDFNDFINRQKTITDQTAKAVAEFVKKIYPTSKVVYSKAVNVSDFKNKFKLFKCRETNDLHHARDAYLNVVVGNVFDTYHIIHKAKSQKNGDEWRNYNLKTMFEKDVKDAWDNTCIKRVKDTYSKTTMSVTRYAFCKKGQFYGQTIYGKDDSGIYAPKKLKGPLSDGGKYGGYKSKDNTAYFAIVESKDKKGNPMRTIEAIPVLLSYQLKQNPDALLQYFEKKLTNPKIIVDKIKIQQLIKYNGVLCYLAGITGNQVSLHNAVQLFTDNKTDEYVKALAKFVSAVKDKQCDENATEYVSKTNRMGEVKLKIDKEKNVKLYKMLIERLNKKCYQGISAFATFKKNMENGLESFERLSLYKQAYTLLQILKFFKCNAETADIKDIGGAAYSGKIQINKDITKAEVVLIHQSPCGLTVRERKI